MISSALTRIRSWQLRLQGLAGDERGISAVEFALLLPLMVTLYLGVVELSQGIAADRKVTLTARTVADLVAQVSSTSTSDMTNSLNAAGAVMAPFSTNNLKVTVTSVSIDANNKATVAWSCTLNGTKRAVGATVSLPSALNVASTSLIWSEVSYTYKPTIGGRGSPTRSRALRVADPRPRQGIGSAVVDLIFSIAKRDVTFFSGTVLISFL
jgi:Flp pilus assembly protein TadG